MDKETLSTDMLHDRMLRALAMNRAAQLNFPGAFMGLDGRRAGRDAVVLGFDDGEWCRNAAGEVNLAALGVLIDTALGAATRLRTGPGRRSATVQLEMRFTGAPAVGRVTARTGFLGYCTGTPLLQAMSGATLSAGKTLLAHASGVFAMLELPAGETQQPLPWMRSRLPRPQSLELGKLADHERLVVQHFNRSRKAASAAAPFIDHFWCGVPVAAKGGARLSVPVSPHLGNRFGHVHGGVLVGMAARTANAALHANMRLSNLTAWFVSPGVGPRLRVRSDVIQQGRTYAVVRTQVLGATGKRVLEVTSQHVASAA